MTRNSGGRLVGRTPAEKHAKLSRDHDHRSYVLSILSIALSSFPRLFPHAALVLFFLLPAARLANLRNVASEYDANVAAAATANAGATLGPAAHNPAVSGFSNAANGDDDAPDAPPPGPRSSRNRPALRPCLRTPRRRP